MVGDGVRHVQRLVHRSHRQRVPPVVLETGQEVGGRAGVPASIGGRAAPRRPPVQPALEAQEVRGGGGETERCRGGAGEQERGHGIRRLDRHVWPGAIHREVDDGRRGVFVLCEVPSASLELVRPYGREVVAGLASAVAGGRLIGEGELARQGAGGARREIGLARRHREADARRTGRQGQGGGGRRVGRSRVELYRGRGGGRALEPLELHGELERVVTLQERHPQGEAAAGIDDALSHLRVRGVRHLPVGQQRGIPGPRSANGQGRGVCQRGERGCNRGLGNLCERPREERHGADVGRKVGDARGGLRAALQPRPVGGRLGPARGASGHRKGAVGRLGLKQHPPTTAATARARRGNAGRLLNVHRATVATVRHDVRGGAQVRQSDGNASTGTAAAPTLVAERSGLSRRSDRAARQLVGAEEDDAATSPSIGGVVVGSPLPASTATSESQVVEGGVAQRRAAEPPHLTGGGFRRVATHAAQPAVSTPASARVGADAAAAAAREIRESSRCSGIPGSRESLALRAVLGVIRIDVPCRHTAGSRRTIFIRVRPPPGPLPRRADGPGRVEVDGPTDEERHHAADLAIPRERLDLRSVRDGDGLVLGNRDDLGAVV